VAAVPKFEELFRSVRHTAVHLELRDEYARDADFHAWRSGERFDPAVRWRFWFDLVSETVARGVRVRRARVVSEPVGDYIRYEYEVTAAHNVKAGEDVRWLARTEASCLTLPATDFWLFDGELVLFNHFADDGTMTGEEAVIDPDVVALCKAAFDAVWERATPHEDYRPV
jgi:hypothetical protein